MNSFSVAVAAIPGPPLTRFTVTEAPALVPAAVALVLLAALGAIVVLVGRDPRGATRSVGVHGPVDTTREEAPSVRHVA